MTESSSPIVEDAASGSRPPFEALLELQDADLVLDQLRHRLTHLPEARQIDELNRRRLGVVADGQAAEKAREDLLDRQRGLEEEIADVTERIHAIESKLTSGTASSFRDQAAMGSEIESLQSRRRHLEDSELEIMEELEPLSDEHETRERTLNEIDEAAAQAELALGESRTSVEELIATQRTARDELAEHVDAPLHAEYEKLRVHLGGIGAARLVHGTCSGCNLALSATEVDAIKKAPAGTAAHCEQCGRILVLV